MAPTFFDPHICDLPPTAERTEYAELRCPCGRRWFLSWFRMPDGSMAGPSWILEEARFSTADPRRKAG
jgi:hypothetical protein